MQEKLFFLEYLDLNRYHLIVDFGCASGDLIERIRTMTEVTTPIISIEKDSYMQSILKQRDISYRTNLSELGNLKNKNVLIIFSSVLHEVEDHFTEISEWLSQVKPTVVIRDMMPPVKRDLTKKELKLPSFVKDKYEAVWGKIETSWDLYHYFLKYSYIDNWDSEVLESYFSTPWNWFFSNGITEYRRDYVLEYKKEKVQKDFGYYLSEPTHRQLITRIK